MIYNISVVSAGGIVLWKKEYQGNLARDPISNFIRDILLQEKVDPVYDTKDLEYTVRWAADNAHQLYFISVLPKAFSHKVPYIAKLLETIRSKFVAKYFGAKNTEYEFQDYSEFSEIYEKLYEKVKNAGVAAPPKPYQPNNPPSLTKEGENETESTRGLELTPETPTNNLPASISNRVSSGRIRRNGPTPKKFEKKDSKAIERGEKDTKKPKKPRVWVDKPDALGPTDPDTPISSTPSDPSITYTPTTPVNLEDSDSESDEETNAVENKSTGFFGRFLPNLTGRTLTETDLNPIMEKFQEHLTAKNVTSEIASGLCESVAKSLVGTHVSSFTSIKSIVNETMKESLTRILTPTKQIDILRDIAATNEKGKPYSIVFVGVNGVGKSTSLSKVCSWLLQNKMKVLIAACDTFRSGAVEQLKVHCDRLNVELYSQGYGKDASGVAAAAIRKAKDEKINVVLIDTAGRMQENEPLMKALSTLIHYNTPNLVLFVGEALVGHDGVHQLTSFNDRLALLSRSSSLASHKEKIIDGVVLTKYDTIDDKVGAAVSMVYSTGIPIMFVGVGQHYTDIKKLNVNSVVKALLK